MATGARRRGMLSVAMTLALAGAAAGQTTTPAGGAAPAGAAKPGAAPAKPASAPAKPEATPAKPADPDAPAKPRPRRVEAPSPNPEPVSSTPRVAVRARQGAVLPEGVFLVSRRGTLVAAEESTRGGSAVGRWVFRFDADAKGASEAPMVMAPCEQLDGMVRVLKEQPGVRFSVSGQVLAYAGRNYLLATYVEATGPAVAPTTEPERAGAAAETTAGEATEHAGEAAEGAPAERAETDKPKVPEPGPAAAGMDEVQRRIAALERATRDRPRVAPAAVPSGRSTRVVSPGGSVAGEDGAPARGGVMAEGVYLTGRRGRLVRDDAGVWVMRFDADAAGNVDPAMVVLPCVALERMQGVVSAVGDSLVLSVSGRVFAFEGRNYLLPELLRVDRGNQDLVPGR